MDAKSKENNNKSKRNIILMVIISILLIISIVGVTYAWFSATTNGNDKAKENVIETASLSIEYTNGEELKGENIVPGWSETKSFSVKNTGTVTATYNIAWANLLNEFVNKEDLVYTLTSDNEGGDLRETIIPNSGEDINILENISIDPQVTQTYTLTITYKNTNYNQADDAGKNLKGKIEVNTGKAEPSNKRTVSVTVLNGTINGEASKEIENNQNVEFEINPKKGYTNPEVECTNEVEKTLENNKLIINEVKTSTECTVTYKLEEYNITYNLNGGILENPVTKYTIESEDIIISEPSKEGYTFNGWTTEENTTPEKNITIPKGSHGDKTYTAEFSLEAYKVKYNANGGTGNMSNSSFAYDEKKKLTKNKFTRTGYDFLGWSENQDATEATYRDEQEVSNLTTETEITLYAIWKVSEYTVSLTVLNGTIDGDTSKTVQYGNNTMFSLTPAGEEYTEATYYCNEGQSKYTFSDNTTLSVNEVTKNTTCTVEYYIPTADACFGFDSETGTITNYYDYEGEEDIALFSDESIQSDFLEDYEDEESSENECPRDVAIPSKISGVTVKGIEEDAFSYKNITSLKTPSTIETIGDYAFYENNLTSVTIPDSVTTIGDYAFNANQLTTVTIPGSVTTIGAYAFADNYLNTVTIPSSVTTLETGAFANNQLTAATIPSSVINLGGGAFANNNMSEEKAIIYGRDSDGTEDKTVLNSYAGAKRDEVIIPEEVKIIDCNAFLSVELESVVIPNSVTTIKHRAFANNQLTTVVIPDKVTEIENSTFESNNLLKVTIPDSVTIIGTYAFAENQLTTVKLPTELTTIGEFAFANNQLTSVTIPDKVTTIWHYAFAENQLTAVELPTELTTIGESAFRTNQLTTVTIPNNVISIKQSAFEENQLTTVTIGKNVTSIGNRAFNSNQLSEVVIPGSVTTIGSDAFANNLLITITIPDSVTSIGEYAFANNRLTSATIGKNVEDIFEAAFYIDSESNPDLISVINKTGRPFDWKNIVSWESGNDFITGSFTTDTGKTLTVSAS